MLRLLVGRTFQAIAALFVLSAVVFAVSRLIGDPRALLISSQATPEEYAAVGESLGLDEPIGHQFWFFISDAVTGDLGTSYRSNEPVTKVLGERLLASAELALSAMILSWTIGIVLGVAAARRRGRVVDGSIRTLAVFGQSMPAFWVGIVLIQIFAVWLALLPAGGRGGIENLILPAVTLSLFGVAGIARLLRSGMLEVLDAEYIKLARTKGLPERYVIWRHALRNALLPVVGFAGIFFINIVTLSIVVEVVFSWPGLGQLTYNAILTRDYPMIQGVVLLAGAITIIGNAMVDVVYGLIDPRVRYAAAV